MYGHIPSRVEIVHRGMCARQRQHILTQRTLQLCVMFCDVACPSMSQYNEDDSLNSIDKDILNIRHVL